MASFKDTIFQALSQRGMQGGGGEGTVASFEDILAFSWMFYFYGSDSISFIFMQ